MNAIRESLAKNMPAGRKAILFGSQARGTARDDSDWDILIILDKEELLPPDYDNVTYPLTMVGWELWWGLQIPQVLSVEHFSIADCKSARTPDGKHKPKCFFYLNATNATHRLSI